MLYLLGKMEKDKWGPTDICIYKSPMELKIEYKLFMG